MDAEEAAIRADERAKIAKLIEDNVEALTDFTGDASNTAKLIAYLLRLPDADQ